MSQKSKDVGVSEHASALMGMGRVCVEASVEERD